MGWRSRFDPSKFRIDPHGGWRAAGARVRQVGLRGEIVVPVIAVLLLAVALGLSALSSRSPGEATASPSAGASIVGVVPPSASGPYPAPSPSAEPAEGDVAPDQDVTIVPPIGETVVAEASPEADLPDTVDGSAPAYPSPSDGPIGEGDPTNGELPDPPELVPAPEDPEPVEPLPPPDYIEDEPVPTFVPVPPVDENPAPVPDPDDGYPPPDDSEPIEEPTADPNDPVPGDPGNGEVTVVPAPTEEGALPDETPTSELEETPTPTATSVPPTPTARPAQIIAGETRWTTADSPVRIERDAAVPAGATLTVDPGVEVQFAPDVRLTIVGTLRAAGARFVGSGGRWQGIVGAPGSTVALDNVELRQAGSGGIAVSSTEGTLSIKNSRIGDNGGGIYAANSTVELRGNTVVGNSINGPAVNLRLPASGNTVVVGNTFAGNGTPAGSQQLLIAAGDAGGPITIEGNLFSASGGGIGATINTGVPLGGTIRCNTFSGGTIGLQLQTNRPDAAGFGWLIDNNAFAGQATFGATGSVGFNLSNNWWHDPSGPADADRNPQGRGVAVGLNQQFQPWLQQRPSCAPN